MRAIISPQTRVKAVGGYETPAANRLARALDDPMLDDDSLIVNDSLPPALTSVANRFKMMGAAKNAEQPQAVRLAQSFIRRDKD